MNSHEVRAAVDKWAQGYTPSEWAQKHVRANYRLELEAALARLILLIEGNSDELDILASVEQFGAYVARQDAKLRRDLAGDRWTDTGRANASHQSKGGAAA